MNAISVITSILYLLSGVGVFLVACSMMSSNLEALSGSKIKSLFSKAEKSKLLGVAVGATTTAVLQSSSAASVMVISFVNGGVMTLAQAATVIFGANVGTTVTGQLAALGALGGEVVLIPAVLASFSLVGAAVYALSKSERAKRAGGAVSGFGMLFVGLAVMSGAMSKFSQSDALKSFIGLFENPLMLVLVGTLLTAVVQSSSVMTSIAITMAGAGLITVNQGIYIAMGANVGTCVTALFAGLSGSCNGKRVALIHLLFNVGGVIVFMLVGLIMGFFGTDYGRLFGVAFPSSPQVQLAMFHTAFNIVSVIIFLPLTNALVRLVVRLVPEERKKQAKTLQSA